MTVATLREVRLYGPLRARFGRSFMLAVDSPSEALSALGVLCKGFREALAAHTGPGYRILVGEGDRTTARDEDTLLMSAGAGIIRIAPVLHGRKRGGVLGIVVGVALLIVAPYLSGALFATGTAVGTAAALTIATSGVALAKALILGGVIQLLSPQRTGSGGGAARNEASYNIGGPVNVNSPGGPVPLIIGRMLVGSVTISAGLDTDQIVVPQVPAATVNPQLPPDEPVTYMPSTGYEYERP